MWLGLNHGPEEDGEQVCIETLCDFDSRDKNSLNLQLSDVKFLVMDDFKASIQGFGECGKVRKKGMGSLFL